MAQAYAALHSYWIGYAIPAQYSATVPSGILAPEGRWLARCPSDNLPTLAIADIALDTTDQDIHGALRYAKPWRQKARAELSEPPGTRRCPKQDSDRLLRGVRPP
ncbi:hypothetical protein [Streptomyces mirabilis]|uniref:hypothetical protein n=1 Tax=Streptomyces mirabilis TaxID=68239 RepID=UPI0036BFB6C5